MNIKLSITEPWEVGETTGWRAMTGQQLRLEQVDGREAALVKLDEPINSRGTGWHYVVCIPRHKDDQLSRLSSDRGIICTITGVSVQQALSDHPCDLTNWRGGLACIGEIELIGK